MSVAQMNRRGKRGGGFAAGLLLLMLALTACSSNESPNASPSKEAAQPTADSSAPAASPNSGGLETRIVQSAMGDMEIPAEPQRIVVLNYMPIDHLLSLGIKPVAVGTMDERNFPPYLKDRLEGVIPLGDASEPNLEAIVAAEPDLIIAHAGWHAEVYEALSKIAPTVMQDFPTDKIEWFRETAKLFGKEAEADAIIKEFEAKVADAKAQLVAAGVDDQTVAVMRVREKQLQIFGIAEEYKGQLFGAENLLHEMLGLSAPPTDINGIEFNYGLATLSWELLPQVDPDHIFMLSYPGEGSEDTFEAFKDNSIWTNLKAVKNGNLHMAENSTWVAGNGMIGLNKVVDEILEALLP